MKNILLTGGAGYIGSHVTNLLIDQGCNVTIVDSLVTGNKTLLNPKAKFINCDIADTKNISKTLKICCLFLCTACEEVIPYIFLVIYESSYYL